MLNRDLVELLNSGDAWAFVGAGASVAAGLPGWGQLVPMVLARLSDDGAQIARLAPYQAAMNEKAYPRAFSVMVDRVGREKVLAAVGDILNPYTDPGPIFRHLAAWPVRGYITTNYDRLLLMALPLAGAREFVAVDNDDSSLPALSADPQSVVWYLHGMLARPEGVVLTEGDYDSLYGDTGNAITVLRSLLHQRRMIFVGVSFADAEFVRLYRHLRPIMDVTRPSFALMDVRAAADLNLSDRLPLRTVTYPNNDGTHSALRHLLDTQAVLTVPRHIIARTTAAIRRPWDPIAANLLLYNELCLRGAGPSGEVREILIRAVTLASLVDEPWQDLDAVTQAVSDLGGSLHGGMVTTTETKSALLALEETGLVEVNLAATLDDVTFRISPAGSALVSQKQGSARLLERQFQVSVAARFSDAEASLTAEVEILTGLIQEFLASSLEKHALGVALTIAQGSAPDQRQFNAGRVLTDLLPMAANLTPADAASLLKVANEVLTAPSQAERDFISVSLQAHLGLHLLGRSEQGTAARVAAFVDSAFIADATFLISYLAAGAPGHEGAVELFQIANALGATVVTTPALLAELVEHAAWAVRYVSRHAEQSAALLGWFRGYDQTDVNLFLLGYVNSAGAGASGTSFEAYIAKVFGVRRSVDLSVGSARRVLEDAGLRVVAFDAEPGAAAAHSARIEEQRRASGTFHHDRQVAAEAEVLCLIEAIEHGTMPGFSQHAASFLSDSRVLAQATGRATLTVSPATALQWAATLRPLAPERMDTLADALLGTVAMSGSELVSDATLLAAFGPLISASETERTQLLADHRQLMIDEVGHDAVSRFEQAGPLELPSALAGMNSLIGRLETRLRQTESRLDAANAALRHAERDKKEIAAFKAKQQERQERGRRRNRRNRSKRKK